MWLSELGQTLAHALVISIVAGVTIRTVAEQIAGAMRVVRAMPNVPALVREGITALGLGAVLCLRLTVVWLERYSTVVWSRVLVEEHLMDAVTGLSGSGPAYIFRPLRR